MTSKEPAGRLNRANMTTGPPSAVFKALILPEIIMLIARHIPLQRDLLSFGLVHSSFHHVVIPYYLRFREVVLGIADTKMWSYLLEDSRRLATVEAMRIGIESWYSIPPRPASVTQAVSDPFKLIESALRGMTNLREVYWEHLASGWGLLREDQHLWQGAFWDMLPRICDRIQVVSLSLHEPSWGHPDGCPSCAFLSEVCANTSQLYISSRFEPSTVASLEKYSDIQSKVLPLLSRQSRWCEDDPEDPIHGLFDAGGAASPRQPSHGNP